MPEFRIGGTWGPDHTFTEDVHIINGHFQAPVYFKGKATLINPTFACTNKKPWSQVGPEASVSGGTWGCVTFQGGKITGGKGGPWSGEKKDQSTAYGMSANITGRGHVITAQETMHMDNQDCGCTQGKWDGDILKNGFIILNDDGETKVTVPPDTIECK